VTRVAPLEAARPAAVEFLTSDDVVVRGELRGRPGRWVILVHDEGEDLDAWRPLYPPLSGLCDCVLAFDLRGHGASGDPWDPSSIQLDVAAAREFALQRQAAKVIVIGAGIGASAALLAAGTAAVDGLIQLSPRAALAGASPSDLRRSRAPKLIVAGSRDGDALAAAQEVHRLVVGWSSLVTPPVAEQGVALLTSDWGGHVREAIQSFLRDYLSVVAVAGRR